VILSPISGNCTTIQTTISINPTTSKCREITIQLNVPQFSRTTQILIMASIAMIRYMIFSAQTAAGHGSVQQEKNNIKIVVQFDNKTAPTHRNSV
jgi:hypothetical protein